MVPYKKAGSCVVEIKLEETINVKPDSLRLKHLHLLTSFQRVAQPTPKMNPSNFLVAVIMSTALTTIMAAAVSHETGSDPKCHGLDCPTYTVLNKTNTWELRRYPATKWAATIGTSMTREDINSDLFHRLFDYIAGENVKGVKIPMTAPVVTQINHGPGPTCESTFTMHFMIPFDEQDAPIAPKDPKVFLQTIPAMDAFVRSFGGFAKEQDFVDNLHELAKDVASVSKVEDKYFFTASYDGPYTFQDRHNEVWLLKL